MLKGTESDRIDGESRHVQEVGGLTGGGRTPKAWTCSEALGMVDGDS